jgi:chromate transporter
MSPQDERLWATLAHVGSFVTAWFALGLFAPLVVLLPLAMLYQHGALLDVVRQALHGVAAAAAGLLLASGIKMALPYRREPWALLMGLLALAGVGWLHWPLLAVLLVLAPCSITLAARRAR